jgi:hypothetical protein
MSLWLAIGAGITFCGLALFELVRARRAVLALALLAGAAVAFSVAGLATKDGDDHHPASVTAGSVYDFTPSPSYDFTPAP